jgi:DNA-binding winged helix-turn-helix (wHTH) protein/Tol biopolymer transport system component
MSNTVKHLLEFGPFRIDPEQRQLFRDQEPVPLSPKAFDLLLLLAERSGQVVLKDDLMRWLWPNTFVEESNLGQHIFQIRKALGEQAQDSVYIATVSGRGYRFAQKVRIVPRESKDEIVLESHSRSRLVIEEETVPDGRPAWAVKLRRLVLALAVVSVASVWIAVWLMRPLAPPPKVLAVRQISYTGAAAPYRRVLTDGSRVYFAEQTGGTGSLAETPAAGGETRLIPTSVPSVIVYDIDREQSRLLLGTLSPDFNNPLWVMPTTGGPGQRLGDALVSEAALWLPDGQRVLYSHDMEIDSISAVGGESKRLLSAPGNVLTLCLAPDGKRLRYTVRDPASGGLSLWESGVDGAEPHRLSFGWKSAPQYWGEGEYGGSWTPDGKYFVFRGSRDGVESFWAVREKGDWLHRSSTTPVQLYSSADHFSEPRFSPDGRKMFFVAFQIRRELVRYDSAQKQFVPYLGGIPALWVSFSPDGKWISYRNDTDSSLWRSRADGSDKLRLTFPPMQVLHSTWSPDGKTIAFEGRVPGEGSRLCLVSADGGKVDTVPSNGLSDSGASWSPDGRLILFQRWTATPAGPRPRNSAVYAWDVKTREARMVPDSTGFDGAHWSPDGKYAAAADVPNHKLMLLDFATQRWSELSEGAPFGWGIRWSSDSRYVYYQHLEQGEEQPIFRVRISDRKVEQITTARQILRSDVLRYAMAGITPDNSPLASLTHRSSDVYALELDLR